MKKLILPLFAACLFAAATVSCVKYDDSEIRSELSSLSDRVKSLEDQMIEANNNISSIWEIVNSLKNKEMVSSVSESDDAWTIRFASGKVITISKVKSPVVGVKADSDGIYYWTMDGEWLLDGKGNKMPEDGIAPQLKIEDGWWMVSTDGGATWTQIAKADGISGDGIKDVTSDTGYVYITLGDDYTITLPKVDIANVLKKIQSIQYVPDYDDGKITVNSALVNYGTDAMLFDQPTEITYQFLPAQYASAIAAQVRDLCRNHKLNNMLMDWLFFLLGKDIPDNPDDVEGPEIRELIKDCGLEDCLVAWFDVRNVKTRAGGDGKDVKYCMHILDVVSADDNSGEITFKVLPINIASESFAAGGLQPRYDVGMTSKDGSYIQGWDPDAIFSNSGLFRSEDPLDPARTYSFPVWNLNDLQAWQGRSAFAAQLRLYHYHNCLIEGQDESGKREFTDFEDELASPYTTLYPNIMDPITALPGAYVKGADGNPVPVAGTYEYQYLPYDVLRENGTSSEPGYRVILDGAMPAFSINGKIVTADDAYKMGYMVYGSGIAWDGFTYSSESLEDLVVGTGQVYAEVEMNPEKSAAERKAAIGGKITGKYRVFTPFGETTCSGTVEITDSTGSSGTDPGATDTNAGYNFLHLKYYTFNTRHEGQSMQMRDFDANDGSVEWWTSCYPAYYTTLPAAAGTTPASDNRISFRHALADYSPSPINFAELAFNVVDADDNILDDDALNKEGLVVKFDFADPNLSAKSLPKECQVDGSLTHYSDLWTDNTTFVYRTNEMPFIPVTASLFKYTGTDREELTTRFTKPKASVKYPSDMLDYSSFAIVPWVPFDNLESDDFRIVLDEHKVYRIPLGQNLELQDQRPNGVSYYVIKDGEWVIGNVASFNPMEGTYQSDGNGFIAGVSARDAYHLGDLVYNIDGIKDKIPADLRRLFSIKYSINGLDFFDTPPADGATPYLSIDYTSQVSFSGRIEIPVHVELPNPWQPTLETDYTIYISGYDGSSGTGTTKTADDWAGTWSVLSGDGSTPAASYDTWTIRKTPDGTLRIYGVTGFTDSEHAVSATVNADGDLIIGVQYTGVASDDKRGELRLLLSGQYTNVEGNTIYSITEGTPILIGHLSDDGESAYLDPQEVTSAGALATFNNIRFFGRYQEATGGWSAVIWIGLLSPLPQTITRVK